MKKEELELIRLSYQNKKVFLTGHTGFKGSWLLSWLHHLGAQVKGYALNPGPERSLYYDMKGDGLCESVIADIRDVKRVKEEVASFEPDFIFHLAAQPLVRESYNNPLETFDINVMGTAHVLDAMRGLKKKCVGVMITTDKVYENREWIYPYREHESLGGHDPYSASKAAAELVIASYRKSFFLSIGDHQKLIASARAGNVIGGGDWAKDRIIPDLIRAFSQHKALEIRNPKSIRPWQHVLEPLRGYLLLGAKMIQAPLQLSGAWNFGPELKDTLAVEELVKLAQLYWKGQVIYSGNENQPHEANQLKLDISKAVSELSWKPLYSAEKSIQLTLEWYKAVLESRESASDWITRQIVDYEQK